VLCPGADWPHRTGHDVLATLAINVKLLVLDVELNKGQPRVKMVLAVKVSRIDARVGWTLHVAGLESAVLESALAIAAGQNLPASIWVELRMLAVAEVDLELLLGSRVEAEVGLIGEVVRVEENPNDTRFRDEGLRLFRLSTEYSRVLTVAHLCFGVAVRYLDEE
jgi:hypothetical protein